MFTVCNFLKSWRKLRVSETVGHTDQVDHVEYQSPREKSQIGIVFASHVVSLL